MVDSSDRPAVQMLNQVFDPASMKKYAELAAYFEAQGSIFPLIEKGVSGLVREYQLSPQHARQLLRRANSMATFVRRRFIEHTLTQAGGDVAPSASGLLSIVPGPSYENLFPTDFEKLSPPQALESTASPVAYMMELLRWIERLDDVVENDQKYLLHDRRKDLKALTVDYSTVHQSVSAVDIIVPVLETFITANDATSNLDDALLAARYPNGLPYYQHWVSIDWVSRHHGMSVGHVAQRVDVHFPYFLKERAWDADLARALSHASRLGPYQRGLLSEPPVDIADKVDFFRSNYGTGDVDYQDLNRVIIFGERTKLDSGQIEALLSVRDHAPVRSPNVLFEPVNAPALPESERSGSVYLNNQEKPAVSINFARNFHMLSISPNDEQGLDRFDRLNRKIRLDNWLELPSEQTDALLVAAINAEARRGTAKTWHISDNVIHALGLYQTLREHYQCTAEDFAAFIDTVSVYGRGDTGSHFDRIFNNQGNYREPLRLDDEPFPILPQAGMTDLTVNQLCSGLGIDLQTYQYLARAVAAARGADQELKRSQSVISSFYRLVKLPRLLGMTPVEGVLMLTALGGGDDWLNALAGEPHINGSGTGIPDVLSVINALDSCVEWCRDCDMPVLWVLQQVATPQAPNVPFEQDQQLFEKIGNLIEAALFSNSRLLMAGVPALPSASWLDLLSVVDSSNNAPLVDAQGLILPFDGTEDDYLSIATRRVGSAIDEGLGEIDAALRVIIVEKMLGVLLKARESQASVVKESLAVYAGVEAEQALAILQWADSDVHSLLSQVMDINGQPSDGVARRNPDQNPLLTLLADLRRRSAVVVKLQLSAVLLGEYLDYGHRAWIGQDNKHMFSLRTLYYLSILARAFGQSEKPQQALLDYLRLVNQLPELSLNALALAEKAASIRLAEFFGWSVQEVRECINRMDAPDLILKDLIQLDLLMRVRSLSVRANMDALTLFLIGKLPEKISPADYATAAEHALLSMNATAQQVPQLDGELNRLVNVTCTLESDKQYLVAGKPGEQAVYTVTIKDGSGQPLSGIPVYWQTSLGTIESGETLPNGVLEATYTPGKIMGTEKPIFWLNLFDPEYAPTINITFDGKTLRFLPQQMSPVPIGPVGLGQEVELYATLRDGFSNLANNSLVRWECKGATMNDTFSPIIRPRQTFTNQEGLARAFISSAVAGEFIVSVSSEDSESGTNFDAITFQDDGPPA
ncbi:toxin [Pseudomonas fluorescens]|uniref:Toxin n=2 Tax=Pseudomonas fluorescens TaxID=294 RepID=A0A448E0F3_PSEFL|nr:toxin [Pseudomonas fluorescens]